MVNIGQKYEITNSNMRGETFIEGIATVLKIIKYDPYSPRCLVLFEDDQHPVERVVNRNARA